MTRFSDAALLKGDFATMMQNPPKEAEWNKTACDNGAEEAAQSVAKQIFAMTEQLDPKKEKLEVITFSSMGPIKVLGMSLTFTKAAVKSENPEEQPDQDDGGQIGFVIFDELKTRKKTRAASKRKKPARKTTTRKAPAKKAASKK